MKRGIPIVISAPSGAGKSTIGQALLKRDRRLRISVSCTTRQPRPGEQDGRDYYFMSRAGFQERVHKKGFVEWARVHGRLYGTPRAELDKILQKGFDVLLVIDTQGAAALRKLYPKTLSIFVTAPTWRELVGRLKGRGVSKKDLEIRLRNARRELQEIPKYDHAAINDDLPRAVGEILGIIRRERRQRNKIPAL